MPLTREQIAAQFITAVDGGVIIGTVRFPCLMPSHVEYVLREHLLALLADRAAAEGRGAVKGEMPRIDWDHEPTSTLEMVPCSVCGERKEYCACTRGAAGETA